LYKNIFKNVKYIGSKDKPRYTKPGKKLLKKSNVVDDDNESDRTYSGPPLYKSNESVYSGPPLQLSDGTYSGPPLSSEEHYSGPPIGKPNIV
jgi:hypothetical protein